MPPAKGSIAACSALVAVAPGEVDTGFVPAFRDVRDGETHLARDERGDLSPVHRFEHLPARWVVETDARGRPLRLHPAIVAGYRRGAQFLPVAPGSTLAHDG